ncbi:MAG: hypothetical protein WCA16_06310 [Candidatus Sulfotelmatobacter sp.]
MRKAIGAMFALGMLGALAVGQAQPAQGDYLDVYTVQVKPDKRAEFDALTKKMIAANRQKGDNWIAIETVYGPGNRVSFISGRHSYADVETAMGSFNQAMEKAYGKAPAQKLFEDFNQCVQSSRSEMRRRRWDLSSNAPTDPAAYAKLIAESRWLRTAVVHVRPGQAPAFEAREKELKAAREKASPSQTALISQAVAGQDGTVYYVTTLEPSLAALDTMPSLEQLLGEDDYARFLKTSAEVISDTEIVISRFAPELSNPPAEIVAMAPDYWSPKAEPVNAKAHPAKAPAENAVEKDKMDDKESKQ